MRAYFERFTLPMPLQCVKDCAHQGKCDDDVATWAARLERPAEVTPEALKAELKEYGAWDAEELASDADNWKRIVWQAACSIKEEFAEKARCR